MDVPVASAVTISLMEPMIAMVISTSVGRDQGTGTIYVPTVTALMEIMNLEVPQWQSATRGATVEELMEEDLAEGCP